MPPLVLECFDTSATAADERAERLRAEREAERNAAYEQGFRAGWDEATTAHEEEGGRLQEEVARSLEALSFTWEEARSQLLAALEPLMAAITETLLPEMARRALVPMVLERLMPLADRHLDKPVELIVNPAMRTMVEGLLGKAARLPLRLEEEPTLGEGQVALRLGQGESRIDLTRVTAEIGAAITAFFEMTRQFDTFDTVEKEESDG